jgi:molecular chaperone DnaK
VANGPKRDVGSTAYRRLIHGQAIPPEVLQACILREIQDSVESTLQAEFRAVLSVPAYFDDLRRHSTLAAAEMAGLSILELINEPTAAGLAFGEFHGYLHGETSPGEPQRLLVYDLGGGTFDATVLELAHGKVQILATDGDVQLGGRDWDKRIVDYLAQKFEGRFRMDPRDDPRALARLEWQAKEAREALSARRIVSVPIEWRGHRRDVAISREQLEFLTADLLERTVQTLSDLLHACKSSWKQIDRILLVGGATRMPSVARRIREISGQLPDQSVNPDEAVARGAAIFATQRLMELDGHPRRLHVRVIDVASHSLGMEGVDLATGRKENKILIPRNTPLPACVVESFTTRWDRQSSIVIRVLQGESTEPRECVTLGHAILDKLPSELRKEHPVQVTYDLRNNAHLQVRVTIPGVAREMALEFLRSDLPAQGAISAWKGVLHGAGRFATFEDVLRQVLGVHVQPEQGAHAATRHHVPDRGELAMSPTSSPAVSDRAAAVPPRKTGERRDVASVPDSIPATVPQLTESQTPPSSTVTPNPIQPSVMHRKRPPKPYMVWWFLALLAILLAIGAIVHVGNLMWNKSSEPIRKPDVGSESEL